MLRGEGKSSGLTPLPYWRDYPRTQSDSRTLRGPSRLLREILLTSKGSYSGLLGHSFHEIPSIVELETRLYYP